MSRRLSVTLGRLYKRIFKRITLGLLLQLVDYRQAGGKEPIAHT